MNMVKGLASWLAGATLLAIVFGAVAAEQTIGPKVGKPLNDANAAITAEKWDEALKFLQQAQAVPNQTEFETFQVDEMIAFVQVRKGDYASAAPTFERNLSSPFFPAERLEERL